MLYVPNSQVVSLAMQVALCMANLKVVHGLTYSGLYRQVVFKKDVTIYIFNETTVGLNILADMHVVLGGKY